MDLDKVYSLIAETRQINAVLANFEVGGKILSFTVGGAADQPLALPAAVSTNIDYPAAMIEAIRDALKARQDEIAKELNTQMEQR